MFKLCIVVLSVVGIIVTLMVVKNVNGHLATAPYQIGIIRLNVTGDKVEMENVQNGAFNIVLVASDKDLDGYEDCDFVKYSGNLKISNDANVFVANKMQITNWHSPRKSCVINNDNGNIFSNIKLKIETLEADNKFGKLEVWIYPVNK